MTEQEQPVAVTVVGTGTMGSALARALLAGGHEVTVWNRTAARAEPLREAGASVAAELVQGVRASAVTIMCVADQAAARELLADPQLLEALAERTLVQLTTGTASDGRSNAGAASGHGIPYLDGAIMAYPRTVGTDAAVFLYAGDRGTFTACEGLLRRLGTARYVGEDAGRPAVLDAALIAFFYGTLAGLLHGAILTDAEGIELEEFFELARPFFATFVTEAVLETGERILAADYSDAQSSMKTHLGGIDLLVVGSSREAGIDHGIMSAIRDSFVGAVDAGHGDDDIAVLLEVARAARAPD